MKILHNMTTSEGLIDNICILVSKSKNKIKKDSSVWPRYIDFSMSQYFNLS